MLVNKLEATGSVIDNRKDVGQNKSVRTPENIHHVQQALTLSPRRSVKLLYQQLNLGLSSIHKIIQEDLELFPYRIQVQ
jgi:hypothetical protein